MVGGGGGGYRLGVCFFGGGWRGVGASTALNRINDDRVISEVRSPIRITAMPCSGPGMSLTLVG